MTWRRWLAAALAALGVAAIVIGLVTSRSTHRTLPAQYGQAVTAPSRTTPAVPDSSGPHPSASTGAPEVSDAATADGTSPPVRVDIAHPDVHAPVVPVGSSPMTGVDIPKRPATLGWWAPGVAPGSRSGSAVLVGHVDDADTGPGALFHLDEIKRGQRVNVRDGEHRVASYRVTSLRVVHKTVGLPASLFATDGPPRLVIITCGGPFDRATHNYLDNIVATADLT